MELGLVTNMVKRLRGYCTSYQKISMFCALSQNYQHLEKFYMHLIKKLFKELRNGIEIFLGQAVIKL